MANAYATLMSGVTTIQSPGSPEDADLRSATARGAIPGPRILTSLGSLNESSGSPDELRAKIREFKARGADLIKLFASQSIRDGGAPTMTDAQLQAACGEAHAQGLRVLVHAHAAEAMKRAINAGCDQIEHGIFATDEVLQLMVQKGTYFSPQCALVFTNYLDNRAKYQGIGNYNDAGFASMEQSLPLAVETVRKATRTKGLKVVFGTDAVAGAHGRNVEDLICRINAGGAAAARGAAQCDGAFGAVDAAGRFARDIGTAHAGRPRGGAGRRDEGCDRAPARAVRDEERTDLQERARVAERGRAAMRACRCCFGSRQFAALIELAHGRPAEHCAGDRARRGGRPARLRSGVWGGARGARRNARSCRRALPGSATTPALIAFGTATALEIVAYYVPWLDHLLDVIASPAAVIAGVVASAAVMTDLPPLVTWTVALIGGGGVAGTMQLLSVGARLKSTLATGGLANPVVATGEAAGAVGLTLVAILLPLVALACCLLLVFLLLRLARRRRLRRASPVR